MGEGRKRSEEIGRLPRTFPMVCRRQGGGMRRAIEEMVGAGVEGKALRANRIVGPANEDLEIPMIRAEPGTKTPQGYSRLAREIIFRQVDERRASV